MPITSSAKKALRRDKRRTQVNKVIRTRLKTIIDSTSKSKDATQLPEAYSVIDRASKRRVIHKHKAARLKSQLSKTTKSKAPKPKTTPKKTSKK